MIDLEQRREHMTRKLAPDLGTPMAERIMRFAHTGVAVDQTSDVGEPLGISRHGGDALLPPDTAWPVDSMGSPRELAVVIDLAVVGPMDPDGLLPHHGVLNFFVDDDGGEGVQVVHAAHETAVTTSPPEGTRRHAEEALYGRTALTIPGDEDLERLAPDLAQELEDIQRLVTNGEQGWDKEWCHKKIAENETDDEGLPHNLMGGWPNWVQDTLFRGTGRKHLLYDLRGYGDGGSLYILIEEQDLRAGDFDKVYGVMECL